MNRLRKNKDYIKISSKGEIEKDSFLIMGGSTKRGNEKSIGRFGSGLKYAIATLLGKGNDFSVFSGRDPIEFTTQTKDFRGEMFNMIFVDGKETNFSTGMGPDWSCYDAIRDIYANAVDEKLIQFKTTDIMSPMSGETHFYIKVTPEVEEMIENIENYFSFFRNDDILENNGNKIYKSAGHLIVYKQGFKVYEDEDQKSLFNYDFPQIEINETRELKYEYDLKREVRNLILQYPNKEVAEKIIEHADSIGEDGKSEMWEFNIDWDTFRNPSEEWEEYFEGKTLMPSEASEFYAGYGRSSYSTHSESYTRVPKSFIGSVGKSANINTVQKESKDCQHDYVQVKMSSDDYQTLLSLKAIIINLDLDDDISVIKGKFQKNGVSSSVDQNFGKKKIVIHEKVWKNEDDVKAEFLKCLVLLGNRIDVGSVRHFDKFAEFVVDTFLNKEERKFVPDNGRGYSLSSNK